jgi:DNA-binding NtrC family response regulator
MDLYHRLSVIIIHVPTLNERTDDIPEIAMSFLEEICDDYGVPVKTFSPAAMKALQANQWTGNIRELHNMVERLIILSGKEITEQDVLLNSIANRKNMGIDIAPVSTTNSFDQYSNYQEFKDEVEKEYILFKLEKNAWNVSKTAEEMDIQRSHLYNKIEKYQLKR